MSSRAMVALALTALLLAGCRSLPLPQGEVKFVVGSCEGPMLESVRVTFLNRSGKEVLLGVTNVSGTLKVPMSRLSSARFVIFHRGGYFDGALRIEEVSPGQQYIMLAPFAVL